MFWISIALLSLLAILFVVVPLWRRRHAQDFESEELRRAANITLFHERNNELEAELAAGNIDSRQYEEMVRELQQNLLSDVSDAEKRRIVEERAALGKSDLKQNKSGRFGLSFTVPVVLVLLVPVVAWLLYQEWGYREDVELMDLFQRTVNNRDDPEEARDLIFALGEVVQAGNEQPWPRYFLAENLAAVGLFEQAQRFYEEAATLIEEGPDKSIILGRVATAMYINNEFEMTPEIRAVTEEALALNPNSVAVLQLLATDAQQREDYREAIEHWRRLIQINPNSPQADTLRDNIAAAQQMLGEGDAATGPVVEVTVSLAEDLELDDKLQVFVAARNAERQGIPPLAVAVLTVGDLPATITLDNNLAPGPFDLSSADTVNVSALISYSGTASPQSGDYRVQSEDFALDDETNQLDLVITEQLP